MIYLNNFRLYSPKLDRYVNIGDRLKFGGSGTEWTLININFDKMTLKNYSNRTVRDFSILYITDPRTSNLVEINGQR